MGFLNPSSDPQGADLQHSPVPDRNRVGTEDRSRSQRDPDHSGLPLRQGHGLRVRGGGRDLRIRRRRDSAVAVRTTDLADAANPDHGQEPVRHADRRRHPLDAHVPGLRQRRNDDRDHAHHGRPVTPAQLRRVVGDRHFYRHWTAAVDLHPGSDCVDR